MNAETLGSIDRFGHISAIRRFYSDLPAVSDWFLVTQELIDQFGVATGDSHWMHTDPVRARRESPYGDTIAHGFWTLSMLTCLSQKLMGSAFPPGAQYGINYGFDRVRFPSPVPIGSRIRLRFKLVDVEPRSEARYLVKSENVIEVEGQEKPALVAEWQFLLAHRSDSDAKTTLA